MWILTEAYNAYDQFGDYFLAAWLEKPSEEQLKKILPTVDGNYLLETGGGRKNYENHWYNLVEYIPGRVYEIS